MTEDAARRRFSASARLMAEETERSADAFSREVARFVELDGSERALDAGTGTGTLALALAPLVAEVVGIDLVPELLAEARRLAAEAPNVSFVEGDAVALPFEDATFDLAACSRTLHHVRRPELAFAELARVTRPGGRLLLVDQLASPDPLEALAHDRIERLRDPSHARTLSDQDVRALLDANSLVLRRSQAEREDRDLDRFLDLAVCEGAAREAVMEEVKRLVDRGERAGIDLRRTPGGYGMTVRVGWYLATRPAT